MSPRLRLAAAAVLAAVTIAVYAQVGGFGFVYDDGLYVANNRHVLGGPTPENLRWAWTSFHAYNWHPLTWLSHQADALLFGPGPRGPHLVNLALHAANSALLLLLLARLTGALWRSAFAAALFALHPLHVESVAWVSERKDVLSALFFLLTLGAYLRYVSGPRRLRRFLPVAAGLAAGLLAKPMLVTLPFVLLLLDYWPLGRWPLAGPDRSPGAPGRSPAILSLVAEKIPLLALAALSSAVTYVAQQRGGAMELLLRLSLEDRLANAAVSYVRYLGKMLWPFDLAALYPYPAAAWPPWQIAAAALLVAGVTAVAVWQSRQRPYLAAGWFLYLGMLVPVIGLVQVGYQALADRYTYLPLIGVFVAGAWGLDDLASGLRMRRGALFAAAAATLALLAARTWSQALVWRDEAALFEHARRVTTGNFVAAYNLGNARMKERNIPEATRLYREALRLKPDYPQAHNNLGAALALEGRREEALLHYREAVRLVPRFAEAHTGLGTLLLGEGRLDEAAGHYRRVLQVKPGDPVALSGLGTIYARQGRDAEAEASFRSLLLLRPDDAAAHVNLGNVLSRQGRAEEGTRHYLEALRIDPGNADAHYNLGVTLAVQGRFAEAAARFREALRLKPDFAEARADLEKVSAQPRR